MKKAVILGVSVLLALCLVLVIPIPHSSYDDGGTRQYTALLYRIIHWNRLVPNGVYESIRIYGPANRNMPIDALWEMELEDHTMSFTATIVAFSDGTVVVEPLDGEAEARSADRITFSTVSLPDIGAAVGMTVEIFYSGEIMESYPAQIHAYSWRGA